MDVTVGIVGPGRLGSVLARALLGDGARVWVHSRSEPEAALAARLPAIQVSTSVEALLAATDLVFLTTRDTAVEAVASAMTGVSDRHAVVHCSGALPLAALAPCQRRGASIGCFHPLQAFPDTAAGRERFAGVAIGVEGSDKPLTARLTALAEGWNALPVPLAGVDRTRYHAAAVLASNCLVGLLRAATGVWAEAGLPPETALTALLPLTGGALEAIGSAGPEAPLAQALTGPLSRGDVDTVAAHLNALSATPDLANVYRALNQQLLALGKPDRDDLRAELEALLESHPPQRP